MLSIPLKSSTGVQCSVPFKAYLTAHYSAEDVDKSEKDFKSFDKMRSFALQARAGTENSTYTLNQYYKQLCHIESIFPVSATEVKLLFSWADAFKLDKKCTEYSINLEKAAILFNMGSVRSSIACTFDRSTEEGRKQSCVEFQNGATIFKYLADSNLVSGFHPTGDISKEGLEMVQNIMLAQAQVCFFDTAVDNRKKNPNMKPGLIAKIAIGAGELYLKGVTLAESTMMQAAGLDASWANTLRFQCEFYSAEAQYYQAEEDKITALKSTDGMGLVVTRLRFAYRLANQVKESAKRFGMGPSIHSKIDQCLQRIRGNLNSAEDDNNTIYHDVIPSEQSLKRIDSAILAKYKDINELIDLEYVLNSGEDKYDEIDVNIMSRPSAVTSTANESGRRSSAIVTQYLFPHLLPKPVKEYADKFEAELKVVMSSVNEEDTKYREMTKEALSKAGLPGSIEAYNNRHLSVNGIPEEIWKKIEGLRDKNGTPTAIRNTCREVQALSEETRKLLANISQILVDEEATDNAMVQKYGTNWTAENISPLRTKELHADIYSDLEHFNSIFNKAQQSDRALFNALAIEGQECDNNALSPRIRASKNDFLEGEPLLNMRRAELDTLFITNATPSNDGDETIIDTSALSASLRDLADNLKDREEVLEQLRSTSTTYKKQVLIPGLFKSGQSEEYYNKLVQDGIGSVKTLSSSLSTSWQNQGKILSTIMEENETFVAARQADEKISFMEQTISKINLGVEKADELASQAAQGKEFYSEINRRLNQLVNLAEDAVYTHSIVRKEFEVAQGANIVRQTNLQNDSNIAQELQRSLDLGNSTTSTSSGPPPVLPMPMAPSPVNVNPYPQSNLLPVSGSTGQYPGQPIPYNNVTPSTNAPPSYNSLGGGFDMAPRYPNNNPFNDPANLSPSPPPPSYSTVQPQLPQQQPVVSSPGNLDGSMTNAQKEQSLVEMGFDKAEVQRILQVNNYDYNASLHSLLN